MSQTMTTTSLSVPLPLDITTEDPVPSTSRAIHKFYEPIILYEALIDAVKHTAKPPSPEPIINIEDSKQVFCAFVNKLSHVCDKKRGGDTVTSFVVLKDQRNPARAHFVFAANRQTVSELGVTAAYVKALLQKIDQAPDGEVNQHNARSSLLYHILRFNRPRVSFYLRNLRSQAANCLESCQSTNLEHDDLIAEELKKILVCPSNGSHENDLVVDYLRQSETVIQLLVRMEKTPAGAAIKTRAMEERMLGVTSMECWPKFFHTMSRILAYLQSVKFLLRAKREWPSLFQDPVVDFLSSSRPMVKPARQKSQRADEIIGRMTRKTKNIEIFKRFVEALQVFDLDARIQQGFKRDSFKPTAHAEVILLNWLLKPGEVAPGKFFNDWAYIGSSKPTCKLCVHYFREHRSNVEHRPCHGNFYPSWRIPDVFPYQGEAAKEQKQLMVDRVLEQVRKDTFDIVRKKASPSMKGDDSNTLTAGMTLDDSWSVRGSQDDYDDIASMMGDVSLDS
ncbi:uncharacterized protein TrAtP1_009482 [Trichoderma atroviride]|uniref:uncharacterized protein n=1 Tax=Hypocrea atroviridis TaxID=63577 RepID=UPI00332A2018|nr:hypothetical protein TrAtP1_009482 [Trichoderma atroviride]